MDLRSLIGTTRTCVRIAVCLVFGMVFVAHAQILTPPGQPSPAGQVLQDYRLPHPEAAVSAQCGALGEACCVPPDGVATSATGPLVACNDALGCDIASHTCVQPCGSPGEVCCDGPGTRALKWTVEGRVYSPNNPFSRQEMCDGGGCDIASHRCFSCGTADGAPCCPPDAAQATARCFGRNMHCEFNAPDSKSGTCLLCGAQGKPPCEDGCDPGLRTRGTVCDICGAEGQPPCNFGCDPGLGPAQGVCSRCGGHGEPPCDHGCNAGTKPVNGLCMACGAGGQMPCDNGCQEGYAPSGGVCQACGASGQPACGNRCSYPLKLAGGVCRQCGNRGEIPCDAGCNAPFVPIDGVCATRQPPPPDQCATLGQACVPPTQTGMHCCQQGGSPLLCVWQQCRACVPHGEVCQPGGTQLCCSYNDRCVLDPGSGQAVCDVPDSP